MACALTQGYSIGCRDSIGGILNAWVIEFDNVSGITSSNGTVTAIAKANGGRFWKYNLERNTANWTEEYQDNQQNGTSFNNETINIILNKMQAATRNEIALLAQNRLIFVIADRNGKYWLVGHENGLQRSAGNASTGTAAADRNGYTLTFTGEQKESAYEVQSSVIAGLETP